jgi:hypothetical protein
MVDDNPEETPDEPVDWAIRLVRPVLAVGLTLASLASPARSRRWRRPEAS